MGEVVKVWDGQEQIGFTARGDALVENGKIVCAGNECNKREFTAAFNKTGVTRIDLAGGAILPGLVTYGAPMGITEIPSEPSTQDGVWLYCRLTS